MALGCSIEANEGIKQTQFYFEGAERRLVLQYCTRFCDFGDVSRKKIHQPVFKSANEEFSLIFSSENKMD
jgi:hypothetical protein